MRNIALIILTAFASAICAAQSGAAPMEVKEMAPQELAALLKTSTVHVIDVNEDFTYAEAHVPGARLMIYDEITADKLPPDHQAPLVFYCYSPECPAAGMAARAAVSLGFANVYCMMAGITGWQDAGLPTEP